MEEALIASQLVTLASANDARGLLIAAQSISEIPFQPLRIFTVSRTECGTVRGGHAHRRCHQFLMVASGCVEVELDDQSGTRLVVLEDPTIGLYIPPLVWAKQTYQTSDSILIVLASDPYSQEDYVDDRFLARNLRNQVER